MKYKYRMVGRSINSLNQTEYTGVVDAHHPKMGLLAALADQFGDEGVDFPLDALTGTAITATGWISKEDLLDQLATIGDYDESCTFYNDDNEFLIEIDEVGEEPAQLQVEMNHETHQQAFIDFTVKGDTGNIALARLLRAAAGDLEKSPVEVLDVDLLVFDGDLTLRVSLV